MMQEDYVSFEVAKLLKEKGFDVPIHTFYNLKNIYLLKIDSCRINRNAGIHVSAPSLQMAMKWLREVHNRYIEICTDKTYNSKDIVFRHIIFDKNLNYLWESDNYSTYEKACEAAIKYVLEKLI